MKKLMTLCTTAVLVLSISACGSGEKDDKNNDDKSNGNTSSITYKDGKYTATADEYDNMNWKNKVEIKVEDGEIVEVDWDAVNEKGDWKKELGDKYGMKENSTIDKEWDEQAEAVEKELIKLQDPDKIKTNDEGVPDSISGCTIEIDDFIELSKKALEDAK